MNASISKEEGPLIAVDDDAVSAAASVVVIVKEESLKIPRQKIRRQVKS